MTKKAEDTEKSPEKKRRLTPKQWAEAETLWEHGEATLSSIAKRFGVGESAVSLHMKRKGIVRGSKAEEHKKRVAAEVSKAAVDDATVIAGRIRETKEEHYKMAAGIAKLAWAEILKAKQDNAPVSVATNNLKALDTAMNVMAKARTERYAVLGLDRDDFVDEGGLPELLIQELTADQIEALRSRDFSEFGVNDLPDDGVSDESDDGEDIVEEG